MITAHKKMLHDMCRFEEQLQAGAHAADVALSSRPVSVSYDTVCIVGMGGSGIAGALMQLLGADLITTPVLVVTSDTIPVYLGPRTLVIVCSYSGNTWETAAALNQAYGQRCGIIVLSSGGSISRFAQEHGLLRIVIPPVSAPRAALGTFLGVLCRVGSVYGLFNGEEILRDLTTAAHRLLPEASKESSYHSFYEWLGDRENFVLWGVSGDTDAVAYRAQTQFNENSKIPCTTQQVPELTHNLVVGLERGHSLPVVLLQTQFCREQLVRVTQSLKELLITYKVPLYKPELFGDNWRHQCLHALLWADFASYYLAIRRRIDCVQTRSIDLLKQKITSKQIVKGNVHEKEFAS